MKDRLDVAVRAALAAGDLLRHYSGRLGLEEMEEKNAHDLVSKADVECEEMIRGVVKAAFPGDTVLGEEGGESGDGEVRWIVDPLDGTSNFLHGYPWWSVSIGVEAGGTLEVGVVYNPVLNERYTALRGEGAFKNGNPIRVREESSPEKGFIATGFPFRHRERLDDYLAIFRSVFLGSRGVRRTGSAALDLACVASGVFQGFFEYALSPWDIAAGTLLIREAGGVVTDFDGGDTFMETGNIVAAAPEAHRHLLRLIDPAG